MLHRVTALSYIIFDFAAKVERPGKQMSLFCAMTAMRKSTRANGPNTQNCSGGKGMATTCDVCDCKILIGYDDGLCTECGCDLCERCAVVADGNWFCSIQHQEEYYE